MERDFSLKRNKNTQELDVYPKENVSVNDCPYIKMICGIGICEDHSVPCGRVKPENCYLFKLPKNTTYEEIKEDE